MLLYRFGAARDQNGKGIARSTRSHRDFHIDQAALFQNSGESLVREAEPHVSESFTRPRLVVLSQIEHEHLSARCDNARGLCERL